MEKKSKNKGCVQWNWSKLLKVLKGRDSVHRGSSVRVLAVFWLFSIDTTSVSCCLLELFPCILKKGTLLLDLLSHHSKPTERVIDFSGTGIKSLYTLEIQVYGSRTKRNCPEFGSSSLLQAGFLNPGEFFPMWKSLECLRKWNLEFGPRTLQFLAGLLVELPVLSWDAQIKLSSLPSEKRAEPWGHGQCPSALSPAQQGELNPLQGRKEFSMCHLLYLCHMVLLLVCQFWTGWCCQLPVVSYTDGSREWPSGKAPRIGTRLLFSCCSQDWK